MQPDDKLWVLMCGGDDAIDHALYDRLKGRPEVDRMTKVSSLGEARGWMAGGVTTIFIDPLALGLIEASDFILGIRRTDPHIAVALVFDAARADHLYAGDRAVLRAFPALDKTAAPDDLDAAMDRILPGLHGEPMPAAPPAEVSEPAIVELAPVADSAPGADLPTVFVSHGFAETGYVEGLKELLRDHGFEVVTGEEADSAVLDRIRSADFFLCLLTRAEQLRNGDWTASPWVIEEKGAALALEKHVVLLVEDGVTGIGGLQGNWPQHRFEPKEFTLAALKAVRELRIAVAAPPSDESFRP